MAQYNYLSLAGGSDLLRYLVRQAALPEQVVAQSDAEARVGLACIQFIFLFILFLCSLSRNVFWSFEEGVGDIEIIKCCSFMVIMSIFSLPFKDGWSDLVVFRLHSHRFLFFFLFVFIFI